VSKASFDEEREERQLPEDRGKMTRVEFFGNIPKIVRREKHPRDMVQVEEPER
jgi:hypothetical protein